MTPDMSDLPNRFLVEVSRINLLKLIIKESRDYFGKLDVILNRPCVYGVFSGPIGGFAPRPNHCVGCLRCTIQHPDVVTIKHNPEWQSWGDTYLSPKLVDTILTEASTGLYRLRVRVTEAVSEALDGIVSGLICLKLFDQLVMVFTVVNSYQL